MLCTWKFLKVNLLRAGQVTDVEFRSLEHASLIRYITFNQKLEQGMGPGTCNVEARCPFGSYPLPFDQKLITLLLISYYKLCETLNVGALCLILPNSESFLW